MIQATVSSQSCFCWLYRASPFLAAKNIINLISVSIIWWCPCVESSLLLLEEVFAMTRAFSWLNSVRFSLLHFVLQGQICLLFQVSLDFLLLHSSPLLWKGHLFGASYYIDCSKCITCNDSLVIDPPLIWSFLPEKTLSFSFWGLWHLFLSPCQCFWSKEEEECWRQLSLVFLIPLLGATDFLCG